jgi:hypothetical protein
MDGRKFVIPTPSFEIPAPVVGLPSPTHSESPKFRKQGQATASSPPRPLFSFTPVKITRTASPPPEQRRMETVTRLEFSERSLIDDVAALPDEVDDSEEQAAEDAAEEKDVDEQSVE